ncbi:unnamed protein product, partial [marine sediment metagenome]
LVRTPVTVKVALKDELAKIRSIIEDLLSLIYITVGDYKRP